MVQDFLIARVIPTRPTAPINPTTIEPSVRFGIEEVIEAAEKMKAQG